MPHIRCLSNVQRGGCACWLGKSSLPKNSSVQNCENVASDAFAGWCVSSWDATHLFRFLPRLPSLEALPRRRRRRRRTAHSRTSQQELQFDITA